MLDASSAPGSSIPPKVKRLWLKPARRAPMKEVESLELTALGISGNADRSKRRQVTILSDEAWTDSLKEIEAMIDPSCRRANVLISGIDLNQSRGAVIEIGGLRMLIGGEVTPCEKMEAVHPGLRKAMRPRWRGGAFARILDEGTIRVGDTVRILRLVPEGEISYRRCTVVDAPMLANLRGENEGGGASAERMRGYLEGTHHPGHALGQRVMYAAFESDQCVGYIAGHLTTRYDCDGELQWIYVTPEHRGTEVAHVLMRHLAVWLVERNARRVCVDVEPANAIARRFYAKHGAQPFMPSWMIWDDVAVAL